MVRKAASESPSLFCEWAVGATIDSAVRKIRRERLEKENEEARRKRGVIKVELTTDDESETDSVRVTYPRKGANGGTKGATKKPSKPKQVRFENDPLKPALKKKTKSKRRDASSGSDTLVTESESGTDSRRHKSRKSRRSKGATSEDSDAILNSGCSDCERNLATQKVKDRKSKSRYASDVESSGTDKGCRVKKDEKYGRSKKERSSQRSGSYKDDPVDADSDPDISGDGGESRRRKESHKHRNKDTSPKNKIRSSSRDRKPTLSSKHKIYPEAMPGPHPRRPNLIRPIRAEVMQVEHTVEGPEDPRPNAFVDERNNVVRVYHGPAYGNPFGKLYPRRDPSQRPLPVGVPHPLDNHYYHGFRNSQQRNYPQSPTGHMPTTLGVNHSSIPATAGPGPQGQSNDLTTGLWGLDNDKNNKPPSWTNNIGPPTPSENLRKANPASRWGFAGSNNETTRDFSGGSKNRGGGNADDDWGKPAKSGWSDAGNDINGGAWDAGGGGKDVGNWDTNDNIEANNEWGNENTWGTGDNQSPQKSTNDQTGGNDSWGAQNTGNDSWANTGNDSWGAGAQDGSSQSASNNVGFIPGPGARSPTGVGSQNDNVGAQGWPDGGPNHVPGAWEGGEGYPDWRDTTAAQSTKW